MDFVCAVTLRPLCGTRTFPGSVNFLWDMKGKADFVNPGFSSEEDVLPTRFKTISEDVDRIEKKNGKLIFFK